MKKASQEVARAASGSWLGYHAYVYYADLKVPPPGAHFSSEWGLEEMLGDLGSRGDWREYNRDQVKSYVKQLAGNPDLKSSNTALEGMLKVFESAKNDALSIFSNELQLGADDIIEAVKKTLLDLKPVDKNDVVKILSPRGQFSTRDALAASQGLRTPPHIEVAAPYFALSHNLGLCKEASAILAKAGSHLERKRRHRLLAVSGTKVFIGHGRAKLWLELRDFIRDRLNLPWDEFNRVPIAGIANTNRLSQMLDSAAFAFIILTGEDQTLEGSHQARQNVIHEAGLFQGRLGFHKAILLVEEGCEEFSNVQGLGQIRFPKGEIVTAFESIREVLEREGMLSSG